MRDLQRHEELEMRVLDGMRRIKVLDHLTFGGGTMLRLCFELPRYSVDFDFYLAKERAAFLPWSKKVTEMFQGMGAEITDHEEKRFSFLWEIRVAGYPRKLKVEIRKDEKARESRESEVGIAHSSFSLLQVRLRSLTLPQMWKNKVAALADRNEIRDAFDLEFLTRRQAGRFEGLERNGLETLMRRIDGYTEADFKVKLGGVLEADERRAVLSHRFSFLRSKIAAALSALGLAVVLLVGGEPNARARMNGVEAVIKSMPPAKKTAPEKAPTKTRPETQPTVQEHPAPSIPIIVVDAGHGGKDPGAIGLRGKVREKDVILAIAKQLGASLRKRLGAKVYFTRSNDTFVTLGNRNRIADRRQADLFLSVHANASTNTKAQGIEIYYLNKATDQASRRLAARENAGAPKKEKEMEAIVSDLLQTAATEESAELARGVRSSFENRIQKKYGIEDVAIKTALFYVLVGAKCPSLLIETGFVTNPKEGKRLTRPAFQKDLANAVAEAVAAYWKKASVEGGDPGSDL